MGKTEFKINTLSLGISQIYLNKRKVDEVLYGMEADESILYYEDRKGSLYKMYEGIIIPEDNTYG